MTIEQIREKILTDDDFVLEEIAKLQYTYRLKHEIRFAQSRAEGDLNESVAEHTWGMHILAHYFCLLEDIDKSFDMKKVFSTITWHDIDEVEVGDIVSFKKISEGLIDERAVQQIVLSKLPTILSDSLEEIFNEYESRESIESRFVKAIDKIEGYVQMYQSGYDVILHSFGRSASQSEVVIGRHVREFKYINRFYKVLDRKLTEEGFFTD